MAVAAGGNARFLPGHGHGNGKINLNEFTDMIVKLYHDKEGDVEEAGKQNEAGAAGDIYCCKCWTHMKRECVHGEI